METKETILAKLNTSPDRLTELVEQDGFYFAERNYAGAVSGHKTVL